MESIIVATDFSATANNAVKYAIDAAKVAKTKVVLFHLYQISSHVANSLITAQSFDALVQKKKTDFIAYANQLSNENNWAIDVEFRMGIFLDEIKEVVQKYKSTMLVLGMPKKSFEQDLLGNTTTSAIYKLKFPILAIPESAQFKGIKKILYACDLTRGVHLKVLEIVKEYARLFHAEVQVFYVSDVVKNVENDPSIEKGLQGIDYTYKSVRSESVIEAIQEEVEAINADILIMTPNKYGFWASLFHRSKTRAMAANGKVPLLSLAY